MLNFDVSKTKPKLQNNSVLALQTQKLYLTILSTILLLCSVFSHAQDIPPKKSANIVKTTPDDTLKVGTDTIISEINERVNDTVKKDSVKEKELLSNIVEYYGEDYVLMNRKENKVYMYNKAFIIYEDMRIDAGLIILDYNKNEVYARGIDSAGNYSQRPVFVQAASKVEPDSIRYNFDSKKALVYNSRTEQNGFNVISEVTKKENDSVVYLRNVKFTTSKNIDDPEYYFYTRKAKFVPKKKIVTGLTNMYIADVPTPIGLPFAYFPLTEDRTSGFIIPSFGQNNNRGFFFQNGGYYFAINDYLDLSVLGDYYTNGSYALRGESSYVKRYRFRGNVSIRYESNINEERGFPGFEERTIFNIRWSHSQDQKSSPNSRFSASVNFGSSEYFNESLSQANNASTLNNNLNSNVSYSKTFEGEPQINLTLAATAAQNTQTQSVSLSLPNLDLNMSRIFPFAPKSGIKKGIIENINFQYQLSAENRISTSDTLLFKSDMFKDAQIGARHSIPITTNFKILKYLSASAGTNYQETWVLNSIRRRYDVNLDENTEGVVTDTVPGFESYRTYNFNTSLGTTLYGTFNFGKDKKIQAIRHVVRPSVGYNITPAFDQYYDEYTIPETADEAAQVVPYSRFENTLYGAPGRLYSSNISLSLSNTFEAKVRNKDTTATEPKKVILLNNLNFSTAYNLAADSLNISPLRFSGSIPIIKKLDLNFNGTLDPYALNNNNQRIDVFNIDNGGSLFRFTQANVSMNYSFSSKDFEEKSKDTDRIDNETFRNGGRPDDLFGQAANIYDGEIYKDQDEDDDTDKTNIDWYSYKIPWDMRVAYTVTYSNAQRESEISSQSLMFSSNLELSPRWTVGVSSGYDFKNKGVTLTQFRFQRDLESWQMSFSWTPIGRNINTAWYFFVGIKSSVLSDIKYDKRRESDKRL